MNLWLLAAAGLLALIGIVHSVMGEQRIFRPWSRQPPAGLPRFHRQILRASWHLPSLLGGAQAAAVAGLATAGVADPAALGLHRALLICLACGVLACGGLVLWLTRGRHQGGTALLATALLMAVGVARIAAG